MRPIRQAAVTDSVAVCALAAAEEKIGAPYVLGARGPDAFDCSGLIVWAYRQAIPQLQLCVGPEFAEDASVTDLWRWNVMRLPREELAPGDIVFLTNTESTVTHGGLFVRWLNDSEFEFVNASSYHGQVLIDAWPLNGVKRGHWFAGAGRLLIAY